mmetsp:Transcript_12133/g.33628  ORF Transcript_12133/g.33628 Transcript_12133/m.33628 type:complete len:87 (-) Transcript_12133:1260-1520(-)
MEKGPPDKEERDKRLNAKKGVSNHENPVANVGIIFIRYFFAGSIGAPTDRHQALIIGACAVAMGVAQAARRATITQDIAISIGPGG